MIEQQLFNFYRSFVLDLNTKQSFVFRRPLEKEFLQRDLNDSVREVRSLDLEEDGLYAVAYNAQVLANLLFDAGYPSQIWKTVAAVCGMANCIAKDKKTGMKYAMVAGEWEFLRSMRFVYRGQDSRYAPDFALWALTGETEWRQEQEDLLNEIGGSFWAGLYSAISQHDFSRLDQVLQGQSEKFDNQLQSQWIPDEEEMRPSSGVNPSYDLALCAILSIAVSQGYQPKGQTQATLDWLEPAFSPHPEVAVFSKLNT